jgi:hypothetical protein
MIGNKELWSTQVQHEIPRLSIKIISFKNRVLFPGNFFLPSLHGFLNYIQGSTSGSILGDVEEL